MEHKAEARAMSIFAYDQERIRESVALETGEQKEA